MDSKHAYSRIFLSTLLLILLTSCIAPVSPPTPSVTALPPTASPTATLTPTPTVTPSPTPMPVGRRTHYSLIALIDYDSHTLSVAETIEYTNSNRDTLAALVLAVPPNLWAGCFDLLSLKADREIAGYDLSGQNLTVNFSVPLMKDDLVSLTLNFTLVLPQAKWSNDEIIRELIFGYTSKQMNLVDWYPFVVPYLTDHGWLLHDPGNYGEHLVYDKADFDLVIVFSNYASMPVVAAPAEGTWFGYGWRYQLDNARTFALSLSRDFSSASLDVNGVRVRSYYFTEDVRAGLAALDTAAQALRVFSEKFAAYPHPNLTVVQGDFIPSMEYDGLVYVGHTFYHEPNTDARNFLTVLMAHEVAHQWWFAMVGNDQALEPWLDEALATYSEGIYYETVHPEDLDWWREQRLDPERDLSGWVDTTIYDHNRSYNDAVYLRGAQFIAELRQRIGDPAFFAFLKDYAAAYSGQRATADDFFRILHAHTNVDISDIISSYFSLPR